MNHSYKLLFSVFPPFIKAAFSKDTNDIHLARIKASFPGSNLLWLTKAFNAIDHYTTTILKHFLGLVSRTTSHLPGFPPSLLQLIVIFLFSSSSKFWPFDMCIALDILPCALWYQNELRHCYVHFDESKDCVYLAYRTMSGI